MTPRNNANRFKKLRVSLELWIDLEKYQDPGYWKWNEILGFDTGILHDNARVVGVSVTYLKGVNDGSEDGEQNSAEGSEDCQAIYGGGQQESEILSLTEGSKTEGKKE